MAEPSEKVHRKIKRDDPAFEKIYTNESLWIKKRRENVKKDETTGEEGKNKENSTFVDIGKDRIGLALSGGGIRSATFNLGILQALERAGVMKYVDYLSTVSGGGYIGSCYSWLMAKKNNFKEKLNDLGGYPFGTSRSDHDKVGGRALAWLRSHGKYLTPGEGLNIWALASAMLTGILINLLIMVPVFLLMFFGLTWKTHWGERIPAFLKSLVTSGEDRLLIYFFVAGLAFLALWFIISILLAILSGFISGLRKAGVQRKLRIFTGIIMKFGAVLIVVGTIPILHTVLEKHLSGWVQEAMSGISLSGILAVAGGSFNRKGGNEEKGGRSVLLSLGLLLLVYGLFIWFYHISLNHENLHWLWIAAILSLVLALAANINHVSMHRFYRNRLMHAYMPDKFTVRNPGSGDHTPEAIDIGKPDKFLLTDLEKGETTAPYHIVNTNVMTIGSEDYRLSARGGDNFIFSPIYCGSDATSFIETQKYVGGRMNLATAFSISGAAVDPNSYATRSRPLSFLMTLLNIRLGYWIENPLHIDKKWNIKIKNFYLRPMWYIYIFREMFGSGLTETQKQIHLSDGGHFENLALYELIRRKCRYIIASDAGADKTFGFGDLSKLIQMVRLDFGAKIEFDDLENLMPDKETGRAKSPFVHGTIDYGKDEKGNPVTGDIIYIKTTMIDGLGEDINAYHREHADYPDESTADQFFDEEQFEAYRELGFHSGMKLGDHFDSDNPDRKKIAQFFKAGWLKEKKKPKKSKKED